MVPVLSDADVDEIYELRGLLEPAALAQVRRIGRRSQGAVARSPPRSQDAEAAERSDDAEAFIEANARFHAAWHELVANRRLLRALALYAGHVRYLRVLTLNDAAARKAALAGHEEHPRRAAQRDGERARARDARAPAASRGIPAPGARRHRARGRRRGPSRARRSGAL